jgi:hypothetical protein
MNRTPDIATGSAIRSRNLWHARSNPARAERTFRQALKARLSQNRRAEFRLRATQPAQS